MNITTEDEHMWLIPFSPGLDHVVMIHFDRAQSIAGLRLWNYNKSPEDTYRGVSRAERSPLSERQHDEWLVWVLERSINPPEPSGWREGLTSRERAGRTSLQPGAAWGNRRAFFPVTVGALPTLSRLVCQLQAWCPLNAGEGGVLSGRLVCAPHFIGLSPCLSRPTSQCSTEGWKGLPFSWGATQLESGLSSMKPTLFQLLVERQGWKMASEGL
jgi:hypothetical protein